MDILKSSQLELDLDHLWALNEFVKDNDSEAAMSWLKDLSIWPLKFRTANGYLYRQEILSKLEYKRLMKRWPKRSIPRWSIWTTSLSRATTLPKLNAGDYAVVYKILPPREYQCLNIGSLGSAGELKALIYDFTTRKPHFELEMDLMPRLLCARQVLLKPNSHTLLSASMKRYDADWKQVEIDQ